MRKDFLLGIFVTVLAMMYFYHQNEKTFEPEPLSKRTVKTKSVSDSDLPLNKNLLKGESKMQTVDATPSNKAPAAQTDFDKERSEINFALHLKTLGNCLKIDNAIESDRIEPTYENLIVSLKPVLGDIVVQMDDWTQLDMQMPDGKTKRIRTEVNYDEPNRPTKYVQLYFINAQGMPEMQTLDKELAKNPTDGFIESLKEGSSFLTNERGSRAYFQEGEETVIVERNNRIQSFTLSRNNQTVSCVDLDTASSTCECLE